MKKIVNYKVYSAKVILFIKAHSIFHFFNFLAHWFVQSIGIDSDDASNEIEILKHNKATEEEARGHIKSKYGRNPEDYF